MGRKRGLFAVALLIFDFSFALPLTGRPRERASNSSHTEVPFVLYDGYLMVVKGDLGELQNVNMMIDTGTDPTIVSTEVARQLGVQGNVVASQLTPRGEIIANIALLPGIRIGDLHADAIPVAIQDLTLLQRSLGISVAAIVGLDLLRTNNFTIDYRHRKITFGHAAICRHSVPLESGAQLIVKMRIADQQIRLLVDSGTPAVLLYGDRATVPMDRLHGEATMVTGGGTLSPRWFMASRVTLGGQSLGSQAMLIAKSERAPANDFDGLLGLVMTGFRTVSFDFDKRLLRWD